MISGISGAHLHHGGCSHAHASGEDHEQPIEKNDLFVPTRFTPSEDEFAAESLKSVRTRTRTSVNLSERADALPGFDHPADHGVFPEFLDREVSPDKDFYHFAAGSWLKQTQASGKPDGTYIGLARRSSAAQRDILEKASAQPTSPNQKMLGDFYASGLDIQGSDARGLQPLAATLEAIAGLDRLDQVPQLLGQLHKSGISGLGFGLVAQPDAASHKYIALLQPAPSRLSPSDLVGESDEAKSHRQLYQQHIAKMLELGGSNAADATQAAERALAVETRMARVLGSEAGKAEQLSIDQLASSTPGFDWKTYLKELGQGSLEQVVVKDRGALQELQTLSVDDWKAYLRWSTLNATAYLLPTPFGNQDAEFRSKLSGEPLKLPDRSRSILNTTNEFLGMPLGLEFAQRYFSSDEKAKGTEIVNNVRSAIGDMISQSSWLEPSTKEAALKKLENMKLMLGAPDRIDPAFSHLQFERDNFLGNALQLYRGRYQTSLESIGQELPRDRWLHNPQTANAAYSRTANSFTITSLYFEHPTFYVGDDAANYGVIGAVAGHEISHGFDNNGSKFDWEGKKNDWWESGDRAEFEKIVERVVQDADGHEVLPGLFLRGKAVVGEAMADLMGVAAAYKAFKKSQIGKPQQIIDGFTPDQRFFLSYAQFRKQWVTDESLTHQIKTDPHPDSQFRVNETFYNNPDFYQAFQLAPKPDPIQVW